MKDALTVIAGFIGTLLGVSLCGFVGHEFISWILTNVPPGEYAGLIKIGIIFVLFCTFGGLAFFATALISAAIGAAFAFIVHLFPNKKPKNRYDRY